MTFARVTVADHRGTNLAELTADLRYVSWRISKIGKAQFSMSPKDPKATLDNLRFGNRILIQFDNGLPNWVGVLDPPRSWGPGEIVVTAYSAEKLLRNRLTAKTKVFSGITAGEMFKALITDMNSVENTGIVHGDIWAGGTALSIEFHYDEVLDILQEYLAPGEHGSDFDITGDEINGKIVISANFYEQKGKSRVDTALVEGANIETASLVEEGPIINAQIAVGKGSDWGNDRLVSRQESQLSRGEFALREGVTIYSSETLQTTLDARAADALLDTLSPFNAYEVEALDEDPGEFRVYGVGDYVTLSLPSYGFGGTDTVVRVLAREYRPSEERCTLILQEQ